MVATIVDDACGERPARTLKPAAKPPTPAPARMARQPTTLLLIPLDSPRIFPRPDYAQWHSSSLQTERNYGCAGTFLRRFFLVQQRVSTNRRVALGNNKKARHDRPGFCSFADRDAQAASSSTIASSSAPSAGVRPPRGPIPCPPSISLIASVSVMRCTTRISRDQRPSH